MQSFYFPIYLLESLLLSNLPTPISSTFQSIHSSHLYSCILFIPIISTLQSTYSNIFFLPAPILSTFLSAYSNYFYFSSPSTPIISIFQSSYSNHFYFTNPSTPILSTCQSLPLIPRSRRRDSGQRTANPDHHAHPLVQRAQSRGGSIGESQPSLGRRDTLPGKDNFL